MKKCLLVFLLVYCNVINAQLISTVAGSGSGTFGGDGGPATSAGILNPISVAVDTAGNLYITGGDVRLRKVTKATGIITTIAGNGLSGFSGDGGPSVNAQFNNPWGLAADRAGNIYIADNMNNRIRKINTAGIITTIAGNGTPGYSGDGGPAANAMINRPRQMAVDTLGNLFFADAANNVIRKINTSGIISTVAGNGTAGYSGDGGAATLAELSFPNAVAVDDSGNVFIGDNLNLRKVNTGGIITTIATAYYNIAGVAVDLKGSVYYSISTGNFISKIDPSNNISAYAGNGNQGYWGDGGPASNASLYSPTQVVTDKVGNIYISDLYNHVIRKVTYCNTPVTLTINSMITTCSGNSVTLQASGAVNYTWSHSSQLINAHSPNPIATSTYSTIYYVIGTDSAGNCVDGRTDTVINVSSCVWPGDADENLSVDNNDFLTLGLMYGITGSLRNTVNNSWRGDTCHNWTDTLHNGKNAKYADCNGDGVINMDDTLAINLNFGSMHVLKSSPQTIQTTNPDVYLQFNKTQYTAGDTVYADVYIGSNTNQQTNFYGAAFDLKYDNSKVQASSEKFWFYNSWIGNINQSKIKFSRINNSTGIVNVGLVRITHTDTMGFGRVATFQFVLKNTLSNSQMYFTINNAIKVDSTGHVSNLNSGTDSTTIAAGTTNEQILVRGNQILIYPNPSKSNITIQSSSALGAISVYNSLGEKVRETYAMMQQANVDISNLPAGVYTVSAQGFYRKVIKE